VKLTYAELSSPGPRPVNEDSVGFWEEQLEDEAHARGAIAALADGVGGMDAGEVASRLAVGISLQAFRETEPTVSEYQLLWRIFAAANTSVYDASAASHEQGRRATTLSVSIFRRNEITVGHVGDSRIYLVRSGQIRRLTTDHTYVGMQRRLNLISEHDAAQSDLRSMLTRSVGTNPTVQVDYNRAVLYARDVIVHCSDGLHGVVTESEITDLAMKFVPEEACRQLVDLALRRGTQDNTTVQIVRVDQVPQVGRYRGIPVYYQKQDSALSHELQVGQILDGRFEIADVISRGGMSSVFRAADLQTGETVAIKVPLSNLEGDPASFSRFEREAEIEGRLSHPGVIRLIPVEGDKSRPYIVMEYLDGRTLEEYMRDVRPVPIAAALMIGSRLCDALAYLHSQGIVHRDLKPQNIMLCNDGSLRVMDFGIAKAAEARRITFGGFSPTMGTPDYMAPEQVKGKRGDERTDIYSLGAILYEMMTGRVPFEGQNAYMVMNARLIGDPVAPRKINPAISPEIEEILLHALEREPADRYPSAAAMKADLDHPEAVVVTNRAARLRTPAAWRPRWQTLRLLMAVGVGMLGCTLVFLLFLWMFSHRAH
jgi:serine/threonine-protein kinase